MSADVLPENVLHNTFLAITSIPAPGVYLSDTAPSQPEDGAIWFQISDPADGLVMSSTAVPFRALGAYQWSASGSAWTLLTAYYTYLGSWRQLSGLPPIGTALADCSWDQIDRICKAGKAEEYFCVGDTKDIVLSTAEPVTMRIIGFHHDNLAAAGGGKAAITFDTVNCLNAKAVRGNGGYSATTLYATLVNTIWGSLPAELRAVTKRVNKIAGEIASLVTTPASIFLLAQVEVTGTFNSTNGIAGEGVQYAFYTSGGTRIKKVNNVSSAWWLRSPHSGNGAFGQVILSDGGTSMAEAGGANGVAFALCV